MAIEYSMFNLLKNRSNKKMSMIEMIAVIIIMVILLGFILSRMVNFNPFDKEQNIPTLLKQYASAMKLLHINDVNTLKSVTFKNFFDSINSKNSIKEDGQGLRGVLSNCHFEPSEFVTRQTDFTNKFKTAAVGDKLGQDFPIASVDNIRSVLNKLGEWRMYFASGKKSELINKKAKEYRSIGDYVYIILIEHSKANRGEFASKAFADIAGNDGDDTTNYYNAIILDSAGMVYDGLNSQYMIRSLLGTGAGTNKDDFDQLVDFDETVSNTIRGRVKELCMPEA